MLDRKRPIGGRLFALVVTFAAFMGQASAQAPNLISFSKGQLPTDTGSDGASKLTVEENADLGGKVLKVVFAAGDSFGDRVAKVKNWKQYTALRFDALNPGTAKVKLELNVQHRRSTNYQTRAVAPIELKLGKNSIQIGIDELGNVNGSAPDLGNVVRWYIAHQGEGTPTLYFSDLRFEGGDSAPAAIPAATAGLPATGYRIRGKVGSLDVDLTVTPLLAAEVAPAGGAAAAGDPARLARIRAAKMPRFDKPIMFDTPEADAILSALEVYPPDNPWNLDVSQWPLHPNSRNLVASIGADKPFRCNYDMGFILVPPGQKKVAMNVVDYPDESDKGPFPIPDDTPIEGWPAYYKNSPKHKGLTLDDIQRNKLKEEGDRHAIVVDPVNRMLYEFFVMRTTDSGWQAAQSSVFDLKTNKLRPDSWTSADAAGLPIFPAVVRYDELQRGTIDHALRVTIPRSRKEYVYPATHHAGHGTDENLPRMGERLRLKQDFDISEFSPEVQTILKCLKKYGMFVADNGISWAISVAPDPRIKQMGAELRKIKGSAFEVVQAPPGYRPPASE